MSEKADKIIKELGFEIERKSTITEYTEEEEIIKEIHESDETDLDDDAVVGEYLEDACWN